MPWMCTTYADAPLLLIVSSVVLFASGAALCGEALATTLVLVGAQRKPSWHVVTLVPLGLGIWLLDQGRQALAQYFGTPPSYQRVIRPVCVGVNIDLSHASIGIGAAAVVFILGLAFLVVTARRARLAQHR